MTYEEIRQEVEKELLARKREGRRVFQATRKEYEGKLKKLYDTRAYQIYEHCRAIALKICGCKTEAQASLRNIEPKVNSVLRQILDTICQY